MTAALADWIDACAWLLLKTHQSAIGLELLIVTGLLVFAAVHAALSVFR